MVHFCRCLSILQRSRLMKTSSQTWWSATQTRSSAHPHRQPQRVVPPPSPSLSHTQLYSSLWKLQTAKRVNQKSPNPERSNQRTENPAEIKAAIQPWPQYLRQGRKNRGAAAVQTAVTSKVREKVVQTQIGWRTPVNIPPPSLLSTVTHKIAHCEVNWCNNHWKDQKNFPNPVFCCLCWHWRQYATMKMHFSTSCF